VAVLAPPSLQKLHLVFAIVTIGRIHSAELVSRRRSVIVSVVLFRRFVVFAVGSTLFGAANAADERPIRKIVSELRRFQGGANQEMDVPPRVAANLTALKHALRDVIVDVASSPDAAKVAADVLGARVVERLEREDVPSVTTGSSVRSRESSSGGRPSIRRG
jgi:hypothetical protein